MPPKQPTIIKRQAVVSASSLSSMARPAKRQRTIGAASAADDSSRLVAAYHLVEHQALGQNYLSTRPDPGVPARVRALVDIALKASAKGLLNKLRVAPTAATATVTPTSTHKAKGEAVKKFGWDPEKRASVLQDDLGDELADLRAFIETIPSELANRLLALILRLSEEELSHLPAQSSSSAPPPNGVAVLPLATLFLHANTTKLSLTSISSPQLFLSRIPHCTALTDLDLSSDQRLKDVQLSKILEKLPLLARLNLRGCTKVGDLSLVALAKAGGERVREVNLSMTAVTVKGLKMLVGRCKGLEVLKLANVAGLNDKAVKGWLDEAIDIAMKAHHLPLSNLRTLKLRSTEFTDTSLGRLLTLCQLSLRTLDISYTSVKSLDVISTSLLSTSAPSPPWHLEKLVISGLQLTPATMLNLFKLLGERPSEERGRLKVLKLGAMPAPSSRNPGLTDGVMSTLLPYWEKLEGLESISLFQNWDLGKAREPMSRFLSTVGRRCTSLDLTLTLKDDHLEGLLIPPSEYTVDSVEATNEGEQPIYSGPPKIQTLVLDTSKITDSAAQAIASCRDLRSLHVSETKIGPDFMSTLMHACPRLSTVNLTSCRGIPVAQRRGFFEAWEKGEFGQ